MLLIVRHFTCVLVLLGAISQLYGQTWQLNQENPPKITITGTSTLHDWTVTCADVQDVPVQLTLDTKSAGEIPEFSFKVPVAGMDGGRGSSMNDKIFEAFKSSENPYVEYRQTSPAAVSEPDQSGTFTVTSNGTLTMAGVDKSVEILCTGVIKDGQLIISGNKELKMSEFGMTPPTAMFGQIKTNDDVVVNYEFQYKKP